MNKREYFLRYLLLKIQFENHGYKMPSHRALAIKFNMSKSFFTNLYKILEQNHIILKKGNFLVTNKKKGSMFFSYGEFNYSEIKSHSVQLKTKLSEKEIFFIDDLFNVDDLKIKFDQYIYFKKTYKKEDYIKEIHFLVLKPLEKDETNNELIDISIFKYFAYNGYAIFKKESYFKKHNSQIYKVEKYIDNLDIVICYTISKVNRNKFGNEMKTVF